MSKFDKKQINKFLASWVTLASVTVASANNVNVTTPLTTALGSAGDTGAAVPLQVGSSTQMGVITSGNNAVPVWDATTLLPIIVGGNEVYARITFSSPNYIVSFYTEVNGVETATSINQSVKLLIPYKFDFANYPQDSIIANEDASPGGAPGASGIAINEAITVTGNNTFAALGHTPIDPTTCRLTVNGQVLYPTTNFTVTGTALTVAGAQITANGYDITTTDTVVLTYRY